MRLTRSPRAHVGTVSDRRRRLPRGVRIGLFAFAGVFGVLFFAIAATMAVILSGPTELAFVRSRYQAALQEQFGENYTVKVDKAVVDVDPVLGLVVEVDGTEVADSAGATVARIPRTRLAVDPIALFGLRVSVSAVEFNSAEIWLVRSKGGGIYLGNAATPPVASIRAEETPAETGQGVADGGFPVLAAALRFVDRGLELPLDAAIESGFRRLSFLGGTVKVWDAGPQQERRFADTDFGVVIDPVTRSLSASIATSGYAGRWSGTLDRSVDPTTGERTISGNFSQLTLADIFPTLASGGKDEPTADIPLYGRGTVAVGADGAVKAATVRLDVGAGVFSTGDSDESVLLDEATVKLRWDVANRVIAVEPSPVYFGQTRGVVTGGVRPAAQPGSGRYAFDLESRGAILASSDANAPPVTADRIAVSGELDLPEKLLDIKDFAIQTQQGSLALAGTVGFEGETPSLALAASLTPMPVATLKQMWVPFLAPGARRWVMDNITDGRIASGQFEATVPAGMLFGDSHTPVPDDALKLDLRLEDTTFRTTGELPPVSGVTGNVVLAGATFGVDVEKAEVKVASGHKVNVDAGAFGIDDVFDPKAVGVVEVQLSGAAASLAEIADAKPLEVLAHRDLSPSDLSGTAEAAVSIRLPLDKPEEEIAAAMDWKVTVVGKNLASRKPIEGRMFSAANVTIAVTPDQFVVSGKADIDGVPADVSLSQPLGNEGQASGPGRQLARFSLDQAARKKLGLGLDDVIEGTVGTQVSSLDDGNGQHYDLDLATARLTIPGLGWTKGIGVPATLSFDLIPDKDGYAVENLVLAGEGFGFAGTARIGREGRLLSADIKQFSLKPDDSIGFRLTATPTGYSIKASGSSFDVRGVISEITGDSGGDETPDVSLEADIGRGIGFNDEVIEAAKVTFVSTKGSPVKLSVSGSLHGTPIAVDFSDTAKGGSLRASSDDAGDVLRFLNLYTRVGGGSLSIDAAREAPNSPLVGQLLVTNFDILNEPAVEQAISSAPTRQRIDTSRLHFERMTARFRLTGDTLSVDEALLRGQSVGATFDGRFDLLRSQVTINGTYLPVYAFNNVFSRVPLIGLVLGGGNQEGLIGVTFRVVGPLDGPRVYFNPLSAVAPGILRKIFEFR
jgi:Protein of unknown function/AsmA-like C-terminal region